MRPALNGRVGLNGRSKKSTDAAHRARLKRFGITEEMYDLLAEYQEDDQGVTRCYGCSRARGAARSLAIDHDHRIGEVRMLLCSTCNNVVGHFRDDPEALLRLALALIYPPSRFAWAKSWLPGWTDHSDEAWEAYRDGGKVGT